jgi:hypothetical protein
MKTRLIGIAVLVAAIVAVPGVLCAQEAAQPGDTIGEMSLRSGGSEGPPIWAFCSPAFLNPGVTTTECTVPPLPELAIGHGWFSDDETLRDASWAATTWELYVDGQPVDLEAFGTYDADLPQTGLPGHDPDEEVITKLRSWDVVLVNPTAGGHTLRSVLVVSQAVDDGFHVTEAGTYELVVNFAVEAPPPAALPLTGGPLPTGALALAVSGALVLTLGAGLRQAFRRTR